MPVVVTPDAIEQDCSEMWYDPDLLAVSEDIEVADAELAVLDATWLLWRLTFERFHGWQCWAEDYAVRQNLCTLDLKQWPVHEVLSVSRVDPCDEDFDPTAVGEVVTGWCDLGNGRIRVCCGGFSSTDPFSTPCSCSDTSLVRVHYRTQPNLPPGADRAVLRIAKEYVKALSGKPCSLPERITSVTRQNVSWTILDPQDFLRDGLTGIGPVDAWITTANGKGVVNLFDPITRQPLIRSTLIGCGEDCEIEE